MRTEVQLKLTITGLAGLLAVVFGLYEILYAYELTQIEEGPFTILYIRGALWMVLAVLLWVYTAYCLKQRTG